MRTTVITLLVGIWASGCSFAARNEQMYLKDTRDLLEGRGGSVQACYDQALKADAAASGTVTVRFKVEADTGHIVDPQVDSDKSTAPSSLTDCVMAALAGLTLEPGDARDGDATYTWSFVVK